MFKETYEWASKEYDKKYQEYKIQQQWPDEIRKLAQLEYDMNALFDITDCYLMCKQIKKD